MVEKVCNALIVVLLVVVLVALLVLGIPLLQGNKIYAVLTDSMEPAYPQGGLVVVQPVDPSLVQMNDVITFDVGTGSIELATQRVIDVVVEERRFLTKGDNDSAAPVPIAFESVYGRVIYGIPLLGTIVTGIKTPKGIMICASVLLFLVLLFVVPSFFEKTDEPRKSDE